MANRSMADKWTRSKAAALRSILGRIRLCGCGTNAHWECILDLLTESEKHSESGFYRDKWFEFGAKVLDSWELIEHGSGIGFAWLTDDGKLLLEFLRDFGLEDHSFDDESGHPEWSVEESWGESDDPSDSYSLWAERLRT